MAGQESLPAGDRKGVGRDAASCLRRRTTWLHSADRRGASALQGVFELHIRRRRFSFGWARDSVDAPVGRFQFVGSGQTLAVAKSRTAIFSDRMKLLARYCLYWSGREDSNLRPPGPEPGALPG